jgi:hypothetical protein
VCILQKTAQVGYQWLTPIILATSEAEKRRVEVLGQPGQIVYKTPIYKITKAKWTKSATQVVEHLLCKHEALSSNSSLTRKGNK